MNLTELQRAIEHCPQCGAKALENAPHDFDVIVAGMRDHFTLNHPGLLAKYDRLVALVRPRRSA